MRINRLTLENYRRFRHADLEFPDGLVGVVGRNGAGKSTLVEAIGWALFGNEAARTGKDLIKRRGAPRDAPCRVRLAFTFHGQAVEVDRSLRGGDLSPTATVSVDGNLVVRGGANSGREASAWLARLLRMDRDAFFTSLVARQRELAALTDMRPADRRALVLRMLRVDAVETAVRLAREHKREARAVVTELARSARDPEALQTRLAEARRAEAQARQALHRAEGARGVEVASAQAARTRRDAEQARAARHAELAAAEGRDRAMREGRAAEAARQRGELHRIQRAEEDLALVRPKAEAWEAARREVEALGLARERWHAHARAEADLARLAREVEALGEQLASVAGVAAEAREAEARLASAREHLSRARDGQREAEGAAREASTEIRRHGEEAQRIAEREGALRALGPDGPCPTCTRPLGSHHPALLAGLAGERMAVETRQRDAQARADVERLRASEAARTVREWEGRERDLDRAARALAERDHRRAALAERLETEQRRLERRRADLGDPPTFDETAHAAASARERDLAAARDAAQRLTAQVGRRGDVARHLALLEEDCRRLDGQLAAGQAQREALRFDPARHAAAQAEADAAQGRLRAAETAVERARSEAARAADAAAMADRELDEARLAAKRLEAERARVALLESLAGDRDTGLLVQFKDHLAGRIRPQLARHATDLFRDLTEGRYAALEVGEDYDLLVHDDGEAFGLARFSGGEQDLANLSLRLAVGQVVADRAGAGEFHMLVLDEIFGSQDEARKGAVLAALARLSGKFRQILLITHIEDVRDRVEHVLRVTDGPEGSVAQFES